MRLLVYNTEGKIFGKLSMHVETISRCHSGFGPPGPDPLADLDPLSRIWTPLKTSVLLSKIGKIVFRSC